MGVHCIPRGEGGVEGGNVRLWSCNWASISILSSNALEEEGPHTLLCNDKILSYWEGAGTRASSVKSSQMYVSAVFHEETAMREEWK